MGKLFHYLFFIIFAFSSVSIYADYRMICVGDEASGKASIFSVSNYGIIKFLYEQTVTQGDEAESIAFAPNGHWGLIGCWLTSLTQNHSTTVFGVDKNQNISIIGYVPNEYNWLVAISPDSQYGIYGYKLGTIHFNNYNNSFTVINNINPIITSFSTSFSNLNNKLIVENTIINKVVEYEISITGNAVPTSNTLDISPAIFMVMDNETSPDGKTCILLNNCNMCITVLSIHKEGGFSLAQQFGKQQLNPRKVRFTPDSKYAIISFYGHIRSYEINYDSSLTEISSIELGDTAGEAMGVTPDGKFAVTEEQFNGYHIFYVFRIHDDGTLEYLPQNDYTYGGFISDIGFVPPYITATDSSWNMYQ